MRRDPAVVSFDRPSIYALHISNEHKNQKKHFRELSENNANKWLMFSLEPNNFNMREHLLHFVDRFKHPYRKDVYLLSHVAFCVLYRYGCW